MTILTVSEHNGPEISSQDVSALDLPETRGVDVRLDISRDDIESLVRIGDDLKITLENGEVITLEDYFAVTGDELPHRLFTEEGGAFFELGVTSDGAAGIAAAPGIGALAGIGALVLGGAALGGSGSGSDDGVGGPVGGEPLDDVIDGTAEADELEGGVGNDTISRGASNDTILANEGDDVIAGGAGDDVVEGGENNDDIMGDEGADDLSGDAGDDTISGGDDDDLIAGGAGDDELSGDAGNDTILGNEGDDVIAGGAGDDVLDGGDDSDIFVVEDGPGNDTIVGGEGGDDQDIIDLTDLSEPFEVEFTGDESGTITVGDDVIEFSEIEAILTGNAPFINPTNGVVVTGTGDIGLTVTLTDDEGVFVGSAVVGDDGTWTIEPDQPIEDGTILQATQAQEGDDPSPVSNQVTPNDTDGDLVSDSIDIDDDGDGITDYDENAIFVEDFGTGERSNFADYNADIDTAFGFDGRGPVNDEN